MGRLTLPLVALAAWSCAAAAGAQTPAAQIEPAVRADVVSERLRDIEQTIRESQDQDSSLRQKASDLSRETTALRAQLIRAARTTQEHEAALSALQTQMAALDEQEKAKTEALTARRQRLTDLLGALERLARLPPEAMIALPTAPQDMLRSAILLRAAVPQLELQAIGLRREIESLALVRDDIMAKRADQQAKTRVLGEERARLGALLALKATLENQTLTERSKAIQTAEAMAAEAKDLRELLVSIETERRAQAAQTQAAARATAAAPRGQTAPTAQPQPQPPTAAQVAALGPPPLGAFSQARGRLAFPAQGRMVQVFGERLTAGGEARGVTLETQAGAQIVAPYDGTVVFVGPFRDYGQLLIIEHGEGYHMLLAGFQRIDSAVSQTLLAGEPVGVMPAEDNPRLYIELRQNGRPINPLPWLATPLGKVSG